MAIVTRPFRQEDIAALVALHNSVEQAEGREGGLTPEQIEQSLNVPGLFRWVVDVPTGKSQLAGYGVLYQQMPQRCYGDIRVHPAWRRRGIGRLLVDALAKKTEELGSRYFAVDVAYDNQDAIRFLLTQGFRYRGDVWALLLPVGRELPAPQWPAGYSVRNYAGKEDLPALVELCNLAFGDLWGHWENVPGMVDEGRMARILAEFDSAGVFMVFDARGSAIAQCRALASTDANAPHILDQPGVALEHRDAGLQAQLALHAAHWLRSRGDPPIRLESWGDPAETVEIYKALGFEIVGHKVSYVRELGSQRVG